MAVSDMVNLSGLLDEAKCFELVRQHRWPDGLRCPDCDSVIVIRMAMMTDRGIGSATCARRAMDGLTLSPARCWRDIISRSACGFCVST